ncbi:hypothetical protein [Mesotoga sp. BH458_6_3_2_1]|nr:hypothetical protein [Mesotoga sp. BH458_6_3_2_1]
MKLYPLIGHLSKLVEVYPGLTRIAGDRLISIVIEFLRKGNLS